MSNPAVGTVITKFNNSFIYTDPYFIQGLGLYRQVLAAPEPGDLFGLGAILPIVSQALSEPAPTVNISFNIKDLQPVQAAAQNKSLLSKSYRLLQQPFDSLPVMAKKNMNIKTIEPVRNVRKGGAAVLFFDITSLQRTDIVGIGVGFSDTSKNKYRVRIKDYNKSNGVNIDSEAPMVDEVIGNTATFSFDITT